MLDSIRIITNLIRTAIYGKDVRENIALGIEQINDREDLFEQTITSKENLFEQTITDKENLFEQTINNSETTRQYNESTRQANDSARQANEIARTNAENTRNNNENVRIASENTRGSNENARVLADNLRQSEWLTFKNQNTMMKDLYVRQAVLIPVKTPLTVTRAGLAINPLTSYSVTSLTPFANNTVVDSGITASNPCYYARNQIRGMDSIIFKTINEHTLNGAETL